MPRQLKYDVVGIALSATPQAIASRPQVHDWTVLANPNNASVCYLHKSGAVFPHQIPLAAGMSFGHGDFMKDGFDDPINPTELFVTGSVGDYVHVILFYEDR